MSLNAPLNTVIDQTQELSFWFWKNWRIHYVQAGSTGPNLLLIHGFGASTDHWRKNIEVLSQKYRVWAIDLLGFGRSQKPRVAYTAEQWRDQLRAFCTEVIQGPVFIAGNSIGGYTALCFAVDCPDLTEGVILLNCAGPFAADGANPRPLWQRLVGDATRNLFKLPLVVEFLSFLVLMRTRNRDRIREILLRVYKNPATVTDRLVEEIYQPAFDEGALDVISAVFKTPPGRKLDELLQHLELPLLLVWGDGDPWMTPPKARRFCELYPDAVLEWIDAGHCPHDENPEAVNLAIDRWVQQTVQQRVQQRVQQIVANQGSVL